MPKDRAKAKMRRTSGTLLSRAPHLPDKIISDYLKEVRGSAQNNIVKNAGVTEQKGDLPPEPRNSPPLEPPADDVPVVCETENERI